MSIKVHIAAPKGRPLQIWYRCPDTDKKIRSSAGTHDKAEAERQRAELEARLLLGGGPKKKRNGPVVVLSWAD
jgi:hypothetical protein